MDADELTEDRWTPARLAGPAMPLPEAIGLAVEPRLLGMADLDDLRRLHLAIVDAAPLGTVAHETDDFLARHLDAHGRTVGLFFEDHLIGYAILGLAGEEHARLAHLLDLPAAMVERLAILDGIGVSAPFRGHGLHRAANRLRAAIATQHGRNLIAATAAPGNPVSWRNLMRFGLQIRGLARMFGGFWRYLMLREGAPSEPVRPMCYLDAVDIPTQCAMLESGYRGVRPGRRRDRVEVGYARGGRAGDGDQAAP